MSETVENSVPDFQPWERLGEFIAAGDAIAVEAFLNSLPPWEQSRAVSRLDEEGRTNLLNLLPPQRATELMEVVNITQAAAMLRELDPNRAAAIVDGMRSDHQADVITRMDDAEAEAILDRMEPEEAADARNLSRHPPDTAGGVMITEFLAFPRHLRVIDILDAFRVHATVFHDYQVQYTYVIDGEGHLVGVLPLRALLFADPRSLVSSLMAPNPVSIRATAKLDDLIPLFERHSYLGLPVTDEAGRLIGVVRRAAVEEAATARANSTLLKISGIVGGDEFRTMPLRSRAGRRLAWLTLNIFLNILSASVVAAYQNVLKDAIALAVFLPIISDMSGCSGNQAVAVSIRELALGLIRPNELLRVLGKELVVGLCNGLALGLVLGGLAFVWKHNVYLGLVVGVSLAANNVLSVIVGGMLPLLLKKLRLDPALMASPLLTTVTDMCGFFFVLSLAQAVLPRLAG